MVCRLTVSLAYLVQSLLLRITGTCTVSIMQLERRIMDILAYEYWQILLDNVWTVVTDCVQTQGIGGWSEAGKPCYEFEGNVA